MVGLGRVELPTYGLGKHRTVLTGCENFGLYSIFQPDTTFGSWIVWLGSDRRWIEKYHVFITPYVL